MKYQKFFLSLTMVILALSGCKSEYEVLLEGTDPDAKYKAAFEYFNQGKFTRSAQLFESLASVSGGTSRDDTVQYYWGLSNYRFKDYYTAETNFTNFVMNYPLSPFAQDARYYRIDCLFRQTLRYELDQKPTHSCIATLKEYLGDYPDSPYRDLCNGMLDELNGRLDKKAFENARLYYNMEDYLASTVALRNVLKDNSENIYREEVLYYIAMSSFKYASLSTVSKQKERYLVFVDDYLNFIGEYPDSDHRRELNVLYRRAQRALGKNPGPEEEEAGEEQIEK